MHSVAKPDFTLLSFDALFHGATFKKWLQKVLTEGILKVCDMTVGKPEVTVETFRLLKRLHGHCI
jgi:hypothetical protein